MQFLALTMGRKDNFMKLFHSMTPYMEEDNGANFGGGDDFILPDDFTPDTGEMSAEDTKPVDKLTIETDYTPFLKSLSEKVKFNHTPVEIKSLDDVVTNFQKGLNYDNLQSKFNTIQNDPRLSKYDRVQEVSKLLGYQSDDELLDALYNSYFETTAQQQGITPDLAKKERELADRESKLTAKEKAEQAKRNETAMYERFTQAYPDVKPDQIKPETWAKVQSGMDLTTAYTQQVNEELQNQIKTMKQNQKNAGKPNLGVTSHGSDEAAAEDAFLEGFNSI